MNLDAIEPLAKLGIELVSCNDSKAHFTIPMDGNRNDKGTLFAGSQYSVLVLAGWYLASHWASVNNLADKVAIKDCHVTYPKPAHSELKITAQFDEKPDQRPSGHWRAKITVQALDDENDIVSTLKGDYRIITS